MKKATTVALSGILIAVISATAHSQNNSFGAAQNMGPTLNSPAQDQNAVISQSGLSLYFASNRPGSLGQNDIYVSQRSTLGSPWGPPQNLGPTVNSIAADVPASFSLDGLTMFLQSTRSGSGGQGGRDNYISTRTDPNNDFGWTTPVNLGPIANSSFDDLGATYFEDPSTGARSIIFSSNRNGDPFSDYHLYQSTRNMDGTFNPPTLIGELSTIGLGTETRSAIRRDGLEIFFGSARPGGLNPPSFDIWVATRASTSLPWSTPVMVAGINSFDEDAAPFLSPDGSILYFHSTRDGALADTNLYSVARCSLYAASTPCGVDRQTADFDGDQRSDLSIFRPSDGSWWVLRSGSNTVIVRQFGASGDTIVPGDYDGDSRLDLAVFRSSDSSWWILNSSDNSSSVTQFGLPTDNPVPGDYDGDGRTDIAVYRGGSWWIKQSSNGIAVTHQFGSATDIPVGGSD